LAVVIDANVALDAFVAAYLERGLRVGAPLATNDSSLAAAAKAAGLESIS
jgi:predicted nucleic acid-binding protein